MDESSRNLHGSAPDKCSVALLLVDVINPLDFPEADQLLSHALPTAPHIAALKRRARLAKIPVIYANDNFGRWRSDFTAVIEQCLESACKGRPLCELLAPESDDYFVLKPKHSAFFSTTLDTLLRYLETRVLIICGFAGDICVLFTANDAYMRDLKLFVPSDCVASNTSEGNATALKQMQRVLKADIRPSREIDLSDLAY